jgi:hypothetical protein
VFGWGKSLAAVEGLPELECQAFELGAELGVQYADVGLET